MNVIFNFLLHFCFTAVPTFIEAPSDVDVKEGGTVKLPCRAHGRPKTRIIWDHVSVNQQSTATTMNEEVSKFLEQETQEELLAKAKIMSLRSKRNENELLLVNGTELNENNSTGLNRSKRDTKSINLNRIILQDDTNDDDDSSSSSSEEEEEEVEEQNEEVVDYIVEQNQIQIPDLYVDENSRNKRDQEQDFLLSEFKQIMRDENQESYDSTFRIKRDITTQNKKIRLKTRSRNRLKRNTNNGNINNNGATSLSGGVTNVDEDENDDDDDDEILLQSEPTPILFFSTPSSITNEQQNLEISEDGELILRDVTTKDQVNIY